MNFNDGDYDYDEDYLNGEEETELIVPDLEPLKKERFHLREVIVKFFALE